VSVWSGRNGGHLLDRGDHLASAIIWMPLALRMAHGAGGGWRPVRGAMQTAATLPLSTHLGAICACHASRLAFSRSPMPAASQIMSANAAFLPS